MNRMIMIVSILVLSSCKTKKKENQMEDFYRNQFRDPVLIGNYKIIEVDETIVPYYAYRSSGELVISQSVNFDTLNVEPNSYWYSSNDTIYQFTKSNYRNELREHVETYSFNATLDTLTLSYTNSRNEIFSWKYVRY